MAKTTTDEDEGKGAAGQTIAVVDGGPDDVLTFDELVADDALDEIRIRLPAPWNRSIIARPLTMSELYKARRDATRKIRDQKGRVIGETQDLEALNKAVLRLSVVEPRMSEVQVNLLFTKASKLVRAILDELDVLNGLSDDSAQEATQEAEEAFQG